MSHDIRHELLALTERVLAAIAARDWAAYESLCDASLSAFEPEARGQLVEGLAFHQFYFERAGPKAACQATIWAPHVRLLGDDAAVVSYVRLVQHIDASGAPQTARFEETRVWQRQGGRWQHVHFHRSAIG